MQARLRMALPVWLLVMCVCLLSGRWLPAQPTPASTPRADQTASAEARPSTVPDDDIPPFHFSPLKLKGAVSLDGRMARLQADIEVHINQAAGWYDVPLRLTQAAVRGVTYQGPREPIPYHPPGQDDGLHWLFRGAGRHHLVLDLDVELRTSSSGSNLQLTLPAGSRLFPSQLELTVPIADLTVEAGKDNVVRTTPGEGGTTVLHVTMEGNRLDVTWRAVQERRGSIARTMTSIALDRSNDLLRLQAIQDIVTDGQVPQVKVRLPEGFRLVEVGGVGYVDHTEDPQSPGWVIVRIAAPERSDVQLRWTLTSDAPLQGGELIVGGFEVQGAVRQTGTVGVAPLPGYTVRRRVTEANDGIEREEPRRLRPTGGVSFYQSAWRFDRQPVELHLVLQELRPSFDVRTRAVATTLEDRLVLDLDFWVQVHAGQVRELFLRWPEPGVDPWSLQPPADGLEVTDATDESSPYPGELQRIELPEALDGEFNVRLQYHRPLSAGRFELALPQLVSERSLPTWLILRGVDSVEPRLDELAGVTPLAETAADGWLRSQQYSVDRDRAYRLGDPQAALTGVASIYPREFTARTVVSVVREGVDRWRVTQRILADVKYGRLATINLAWPPVFPATGREVGALAVRCRAETGQPLAITETGSQLVVTLPTTMQGAIPIVVEFLLPATPAPEAAATGRLDVPIFTLPEAPFSSTLVEFPSSNVLQVAPRNTAWRAVPTALEPSWVTTASLQAFSADLSFDVSGAPQKYQVESALARVAFDPSGRSRVRVDYRVRRAPARLVLELPEDADTPEFLWQGQAPAGVTISEPTPAGRRCELQLTADADTVDGWLRVEYGRTRVTHLDALALLPADFPVLPDAVAVNETYIEIGIPADFCLLTYPVGLTPVFEWRAGFVFQREPTEAYLARRLELEGPALPPQSRQSFFAAGGAMHVYAFWGTGSVTRTTVRSIRLWMLILIGSGLTLGLAFLLWSVPATRDVMTLLVLGFLIAVAGVFAPEVVELLLQPVLLGLAAAVVAIGLQARNPRGMSPPARRRDDHSTRSEHPRSGAPLPPAATPGTPAVNPALAPTQIGPREMLETGSRP